MLRANWLHPIFGELDPIDESKNPAGIDATGPHAKPHRQLESVSGPAAAKHTM